MEPSGAIKWGTPHIQIWDIWPDLQTRVGTPHKNLRCLSSRGGNTAKVELGKNAAFQTSVIKILSKMHCVITLILSFMSINYEVIHISINFVF